jgi:hypothetical protein
VLRIFDNLETRVVELRSKNVDRDSQRQKCMGSYRKLAKVYQGWPTLKKDPQPQTHAPKLCVTPRKSVKLRRFPGRKTHSVGTAVE